MSTLTQTKISKIFGVSKSTAKYWIDNALKGRNKLMLKQSETTKKLEVLDTPYNMEVLGELKEMGANRANTQYYREVEPLPKFYEIFSSSEIDEIISDLSGENPRSPYKYCYRAAANWNRHYKTVVKNNSQTGNLSTGQKTVKLFQYIWPKVRDIISEAETVSVIELGPGTAEPTVPFIRQIMSDPTTMEKLKSYVAVDISKDINNMARDTLNSARLTEWIELHQHVCDIEDSYKELMGAFRLALPKGTKKSKHVNIILHVGATIGNHADTERVLKNIAKCMSSNDILIFDNPVTTGEKILDGTPTMKSREVRTAFNLMSQWIIEILGVKREDIEHSPIINYDDKKAEFVSTASIAKTYKISIKTGLNTTELVLNKNTEIEMCKFRKFQLDKVDMFFKTNGLSIEDRHTLPDYPTFCMFLAVKTAKKKRVSKNSK
jgi:uncharacterized SAM-dependent methyltransferase